MNDWFYSFCRGLLTPAAKLLFPVRCIGKENIPSSGRLILCCNHKSVFDPILLAVAFDRPIRFMAKSELFEKNGRRRPFGAVLTALRAFPVRRNQGDLGAIKAAERVLREESVLGIFPEGGVVRETGFTPKAGVALIAARSGCPVLPAAVCCRGALRPFRKAAIRFGRVIFGEEFPMRGDNADVRALSGLIADRINELLEAGF